MPLSAQICMVLVTIALVTMAAMTIRLMLQTRKLIETATRSLAELPALIEDVKRMSARADELLRAFSQITNSARCGVAQVEGFATRTSALVSQLLDEVEPPVSRTVGWIRGIKAGASFLFQRWHVRASQHSPTTQGDDHVGEQRWLDDGGIPGGSGGRSRAGSDLRANGR
jgi:hypothetical protein